MRVHRPIAIPFVFIILLNSSGVFACGESLFRVGKDVHYRAYSAPIPGSVLVYARTDDERAVAQELANAGHQVRVVNNDVSLSLEMQVQQFDVIIAPYSKRAAVEAESSEIASNPDWVPVVMDGTDEEKLAGSQYDYTVGADDDIRKYLKAIHKNLKKRDS
jgi:hypothetical protein